MSLPLDFSAIVEDSSRVTQAVIQFDQYVDVFPHLVGEAEIWADSIKLSFVLVPEPTTAGISCVALGSLILLRRKLFRLPAPA